MNATDTISTTDGPLAVVGATGQQGGAVVSALLERGAPVRALVRDPAADRARQLGEAGADGVPLQMISTRDIGRAAAAALLDPDRVPGGAVEIAGDELTGEEIAAAFAQARDVPARYEAMPVDVLPDEDQRAMFTWFAQLPAYRADVALTRELVPDVQNLRTWVEGRRW